MKIDLHVHTCHSRRPAIWVLQKIGCPESFTDPVRCYHHLKRLGMNMVTFTDHNVIDGCLAVAHLPDTFISEEITAYFPEDSCKVHVLAYNLTEKNHQVIAKKRANLYELVDYLREQEIPHAIAHPFSAVHNRFALRHFEKLLLLFNIFELNGDQDRSVTRQLRSVLDTLTRDELDALSRKHGIAPYSAEPWRKRLVCGSDDHAEIRFGNSFTEVADATYAGEFFAGVAAGSAAVQVKAATGQTFARDIYSLAYRYVKDRFALTRYSGSDTLLRFCDTVLEPRSSQSYSLLSRIGYALHSLRQPRPSDAAASLTDFMRSQAERLIRQTPELSGVLDIPAADTDDGDAWFSFVNRIANLTVADLADSFMKRLRDGRYFDLFHLLGNAGTLSLMLSPYFAAYSFFAAERRLANNITRQLRPEYAGEAVKVACLTDTFYENNSLADSLWTQLSGAQTTHHCMRIFTVREDRQTVAGVHHVEPACFCELPDTCGFRLGFPALLPLLRHIFENDYSCLQAASAGPAGLTALLLGQLLGLPVYATYQPGVADYLRGITEDRSLSDLGVKYMTWFFNQCDLVQVETGHALETLAAAGVIREKLRICARGVDRRMFSPDRSSDAVRSFHVGSDATPRIPSDETAMLIACAGGPIWSHGLQMLMDVFQKISPEYPHARLILPYLTEDNDKNIGVTIRKHTNAVGQVVFSQELSRMERAQLYASCDLLVLPQGEHRHGGAVLEAQASGLPTLVCDEGNVPSRIREGVTGDTFQPGDAHSLETALRRMLDLHPELRRAMGARARDFSRQFDHEAAFAQHWRQVEELVTGKHPPHKTETPSPRAADATPRETEMEGLQFLFDNNPAASWLRDTVGVS